MQNIPNPDVNSTEDEYGNRTDIEGESQSSDNTENIPLPPTEPKPVAVEEPPADADQASIDEPQRKPSEIV